MLKTKDSEIVWEGFAIALNHQFQYIENNHKMIIDITEDCATMERKNDEYTIYFHFQKENSYGKIVLEGKELLFDVVLKTFQYTSQEFKIIYEFNGVDYEYTLYY